MSTYELPLPTSARLVPPADRKQALSIPKSLFVRNVMWSCRFRWIVITVLAAAGLLGLFIEEHKTLGLLFHTKWAFLIAGILALANLAFLAHVRDNARHISRRATEINLWVQIVLDLLILTFVIHFVGSLETNILFAYLFHIVLACIFFPPRRSFTVTLIACAMYLTCILVEVTDTLSVSGIYTDTTVREHILNTPVILFLNVASALTIWLVVWYLASHLSAMVQERGRQLAETNRRLEEMHEERRHNMLRMTHELKAPFAAIQANAELLLKGYCGELSGEAHNVLSRITERCRRLTFAILEMLQLANLRSASEESHVRWVEIDLANTLSRCIGQVRQIAEERRIVIEEDLRPARATVVEDHIRIVFLNLLSNAIHYSQAGGRIQVQCVPRPGTGPEVAIEDHGIGIPEEKLPHIFDEYYRTEEAVRHNKGSTGLGLTIVRHVVEKHEIRLCVESKLGVGTRVTLQFPADSNAPLNINGEKED